MSKEFIDSIDSNVSILTTKDLSVYYGKTKAVSKVSFNIPRNKIVALIGPSGCGKSTLIRCFNRMNDLIPSAKVEGDVKYNQTSIYSDKSDPTYIRFKIGMVFQKPNPFPKSIYENVAFGPKINGFKSNEIEDIVETSLKKASPDLIIKQKNKFFEIIYLYAGNQVLSGLIDTLTCQSWRWRTLGLTHPNRDPKRQHRSLKNLSNLYQAILQKDISKATLIIDIEVKDSQDEILRLIKIDTGVE